MSRTYTLRPPFHFTSRRAAHRVTGRAKWRRRSDAMESTHHFSYLCAETEDRPCKAQLLLPVVARNRNPVLFIVENAGASGACRANAVDTAFRFNKLPEAAGDCACICQLLRVAKLCRVRRLSAQPAHATRVYLSSALQKQSSSSASLTLCLASVC